MLVFNLIEKGVVGGMRRSLHRDDVRRLLGDGYSVFKKL